MTIVSVADMSIALFMFNSKDEREEAF